MPAIEIATGSPDGVRAMARRRNLDDRWVRLSLQAAQCATVWLARDDGEAIGIAVAHDTVEARYVGELFVEPSYRRLGIARRLLEQCFASEDVARSMLVDPDDAAGGALALRFRMAPTEAIWRFAGVIPNEEELAKMAAGNYRFAVAPIDLREHEVAIDELDRQTRGTSRGADHAAFAQSATGAAFFLNGESVGYTYVWPDGSIGPLACASEAYLVQIFAYALLTLQRSYSASWCSALVPGSNRRIARAALRAGLRIEQSFLLAQDTAIANLSTYVGYHQLLL
ncbi:MAG: GNAT family N-acetyltransferase [Candidatus Eremiobacteraeota bacterium]|nr:GNAT family N-acetyltransferase [Candidatus Eremiobacteraeota bacterium]